MDPAWHPWLWAQLRSTASVTPRIISTRLLTRGYQSVEQANEICEGWWRLFNFNQLTNLAFLSLVWHLTLVEVFNSEVFGTLFLEDEFFVAGGMSVDEYSVWSSHSCSDCHLYNLQIACSGIIVKLIFSNKLFSAIVVIWVDWKQTICQNEDKYEIGWGMQILIEQKCQSLKYLTITWINLLIILLKLQS